MPLKLTLCTLNIFIATTHPHSAYMQIYLTCFVIILCTLSACTVLDESGELVSDPGCMNSAILPTPTPTPTIDFKDPESSSDGVVAGVATAVGALFVVIIVVVAYMMTRKRRLLQQKIFEEPSPRYFKILCGMCF